MGSRSPVTYPALAIASLVLLTTATLAIGREHAAPREALVFLTRDGCVNTTTMRTRLDEALDRLKVEKDYAVIDADTLSDSDVRRGYGTPTVLYEGQDLFGMPEPTPPVPSPT